MNIYKKWTYLFLSSVISLLSIVLIFNFRMDVAGVMRTPDYLQEASRAIIEGKIIAGLSNFDERTLEKLVIQNNNKKMDAIVVGSSTSMMLRKNYFWKSDVNFYNHSMSRGSLEDFIAIVAMYEKYKGYIPSKVMIGLDPWIFNAKHGEDAWLKLKEETFFILDKLEINNKPTLHPEGFLEHLEKIKSIQNWEYTLLNAKFFIRGLKSGSFMPFTLPLSKDVDDMIIEEDGSRDWPYSSRHIDPEFARKIALQKINSGYHYAMDHFELISNQEMFEGFVEYLVRNKSKVSFYLPPYQPDAYLLLIANPRFKILIEVEKYIKDYAKKMNISVLGSYDPRPYGFTYHDFMDECHPQESVPRKILAVQAE